MKWRLACDEDFQWQRYCQRLRRSAVGRTVGRV